MVGVRGLHQKGPMAMNKKAMNKKVLVDSRQLTMLIDMFISPSKTLKDLEARLALIDQRDFTERITKLHPGPGFTPAEQVDLREEYESWPVQELAAAYARETFKAQLLLEILGKRLLKDNQQGTAL